MYQTRYRSSLQAAPGNALHRGVGSGSANTFGPHGGYGSYSVPATLPVSVNSRVQPTAYLLQQRMFNTPTTPNWQRAAAEGIIMAGAQRGLSAIGASWLTQGLVLALGSEIVNKALTKQSAGDQAEDLVRVENATRQLSNPFERASMVGSQVDRVIQLGRLGHLGNPAASTGISTATAISSVAIGSGTSLASSATWLAAAGGPIGIGVAAATVALTYLLTRQRPARKVATTEIVNEVEPLLQRSVASYISGPRTAVSQQQAIANFEAGWNFVTQNCGNPNMGEPGKWCVDDRKRGGKWDWFASYLDPIANDTRPAELAAQQPNELVQYQASDGSIVQTTAGNVVGVNNVGMNVDPYGNSGGINPVLLIGGLLIAGVLIANG